jgi:hypothetical protein
VSWNVREMPSAQTSCGVSPLTGALLKRTAPLVGASSPAMRLNSVDLPAPLGPMIARISPRKTLSET